MANTESDEFAPILPGPAPSDYERYLRTDELLALQKGADEWAHRDELLFQTVHQSSELWLKLAASEVDRATAHVQANEVAAALRLLRRASLCLSVRRMAASVVSGRKITITLPAALAGAAPKA